MPPNPYILIAIRFIIGIGIGGTLVVVCAFSMEMLLPQQRMALRAFFNWVIIIYYIYILLLLLYL